MTFSRSLLTAILLLSVSTAPSQNVTDAGAPLVERKSVRFSFPGGSLGAFHSEVQREFALDPMTIQPIHERYLRMVRVPAFDLEAKDLRDVLLEYNELAKSDPRMGEWVLPERPAGSVADGKARFNRGPVRQGGRFEFHGGALQDLIDEIALQFGVDLDQLATIPEELRHSIRTIPKMRLRTADLTAVLALYNDISKEGDDFLGRWIVKRQGDEFASVVLQPRNASDLRLSSQVVVRAFPLRLTQTALSELREVIMQEVMQTQILLQQQSRGPVPEPKGSISYHSGTGILVISGSPRYVDIAGEIVNAYREGTGQAPGAALPGGRENGR